MKRSIALASIVVLGAAAMIVNYKLRSPGTPRELFEVRCSACHALPDLSGYARHEMAPLVSFMRTHNGASRVISDEEAHIITIYLENSREK